MCTAYPVRWNVEKKKRKKGERIEMREKCEYVSLKGLIAMINRGKIWSTNGPGPNLAQRPFSSSFPLLFLNPPVLNRSIRNDAAA